QGTDLAIEHHVRGNQLAHDFHRVGVAVGQRGIVFVVAVFVFGNVQIEFANGVGAVVFQFIACRVFQAFARQHHNGAAHASDHVPGDHAFGCAVIHEHTAAVGLEAHGGLFARCDISQLGTAQRSGGRVEVHIVRHGVAGRVDQGNFNVVAFVHNHGRARHGTVERHGLHRGALVIDHDFLFFDDHGEFDHLG